MILGVSPTYKIPYSVNTSVGATREIGSALSVRADYVHTETKDPSIGPDTNWNQNADGSFSRRDARYGNITLVTNGGFIKYDGLDVMPFGGTKLSGIGREGVRFAVDGMTDTRVVCFSL